MFTRLNILFTLAIGAGLIHLLARRNYLAAVLAAVPLMIVDRYLDGGAWTPIAAALAYACCQRSPAAALAVITIAALIGNFAVQLPGWEPVMMVLAAPLIVLGGSRVGGAGLRLPGMAFYAFYPLHLLVIWLAFGPYHW
jgi:hypothetical protein